MNSDEPMLAAANDLRETISDLLEVHHSDRIILAPGILVALRTLFSHLQIERIALTSEEYYGVEHFPGATVRAASCDALFDPRLTGDSEAVLASPASWRGARQPVAELFDSIRKTSGEGAPLLVADYAHAGSVGFPSVDRLGADVICGDLEKWILPPDWNTRVAFLWFRTQQLFLRAVKAFRPFFLATQASDVSMLARWVEPTDVLAFDLREEASQPLGKPTQVSVDGDIVVSLETAQREADRRGHALWAELALYVVHGTLHLLGHDDGDAEQAAGMHQIENEILTALGYGAVYEVQR